MSKSILVIDTPEYCTECPLCIEDHQYRDRCLPLYELIFTSGKPDWCPLKPAPQEQDVWHDDERSDWERGYNNCVREILGGWSNDYN